MFETIVSTDKGQMALSAGKLVNQWTKDGRSFYHYKTVQNVEAAGVYFSADYEVRNAEENGIRIEQYYHAGHEQNIDRVEESTKVALNYCIENFGPYPYDHLRIVEVPGHWNFGGAAHPGIISMVEDKLYLLDNRDVSAFDLVAKRTIHEVAHQWWGGILSPKYVAGSPLLVEGFTKYTEAVVMEKIKGKGAVWQLSLAANNRYFGGRAFATKSEPPLYLSEGQSYLAYGKNYTVMLALRELLGEQTVNQVLRIITDNYSNDDGEGVTSIEFLEELYKVTPDQYHKLIDDWFKRVITYDLAIVDQSYVKLPGNQYQITLTISAKRFETLSNGETKPIEIDEPISIGLFAKEPKHIKNDSAILYANSHQINNESMEIKIVVDELPKYVAIDPFGTRSDKNLFDNVMELK